MIQFLHKVANNANFFDNIIKKSYHWSLKYDTKLPVTTVNLPCFNERWPVRALLEGHPVVFLGAGLLVVALVLEDDPWNASKPQVLLKQYYFLKITAHDPATLVFCSKLYIKFLQEKLYLFSKRTGLAWSNNYPQRRRCSSRS